MRQIINNITVILITALLYGCSIPRYSITKLDIPKFERLGNLDSVFKIMNVKISITNQNFPSPSKKIVIMYPKRAFGDTTAESYQILYGTAIVALSDSSFRIMGRIVNNRVNTSYLFYPHQIVQQSFCGNEIIEKQLFPN